MAAALLQMRPDVDVTVVEPEELDATLDRLVPHVVFSNIPTLKLETRDCCWVTIYPQGQDRAVVCVHGERTRIESPQLNELLGLLDDPHCSTIPT
jgi:hypothetical protein